ncbi:ABC transporter permease [Microbacterium resistens]
MIALLRQRLRRDRLQLLLWVLGTVALALAAVGGASSSYGTEKERTEVLATVMANPVILLFRGLPSGAERAAFTLFLILPFLAMLAGFLSTFLAVRHTRAEEELGRAELVAATAAARLTPLLATIVHGVLADVVLGLLVAASFLSAGFPVAGSAVAGLAVASVGLCFLGVGLAAGQIMRTSRGANALAVWLLVGTYVIAGLGNALGTPNDDLTRMESSPLAWFSPFGWAMNTRPYADDAVWPALLGIGAGAVLTLAAIGVQSVRDIGAGIVPERRGRTDAPAALASGAGLVWRLTRGSVLGWAAGALVTGLLATSLAAVVNEIGTKVEAVQRIFEALSDRGGLEEGLIVIFYIIVGVLAACAAVQTVCRARQEEAHGTAEAVLATAVDRVRWLAGYVGVAVLAVVLVAAAAVAGSALGVAGRGDEAGPLLRGAALAGAGQAAAACVFLALTALVFVLLPRGTVPVGWTLVLLAVMVGLFGPLFSLPDWLANASPFAQTPTVSGDEIDPKGVWWLIAAAAAGIAAALGLMRRRELHPAG